MSTNELMGLIGEMGRHYRLGGVGYTWLDAALDVVGEHGYTILSDNGDGDGPAAILINDETLDNARQLLSRQCELGKMVDGATEAGPWRSVLTSIQSDNILCARDQKSRPWKALPDAARARGGMD